MKNTFFQKFAFTLAEVLITLVIIGVVAAMTIPTLIAKHQDQVTVTKLKKAQAALAQAFSIENAKNGPLIKKDSTNFWSWINYQEVITNIFENFKSAQLFDVDECSSYWGGSSGYMCALTQDGILYGIHTSPQYYALVCTNFSNNKCTNLYPFTITENVNLIPNGAPDSDYEIKRTDVCPNANNWENPCAYWTLKTGKVKKKSGEWFDE